MVVYGYLRVSTEKQHIENYKSSILNYCNDHKLGNVVWIQETISGRKQWQKRLLGKEFLKMVSGDIIVTAEFSRIGRDLLNSMSFIAEAKERGIKVYSINGDIPEDTSANSTLILAMAGWKNQTERELIAQRTRVGLKAAKERGVKLGRKVGSSKLDKDLNNIRNIEADLKMGMKKKAICAKYRCTIPTLRKFIKTHNLIDKFQPEEKK